ncbi:regulatory protein RecX [Marinihelvus fidelis]|uniref:regulatory protein RecX n=1 Tax=Marinihelvus fidelis TaxID=2613842 RepID=UPI0017830DB7|nr:regulatory protein RecX [Marinihelvus fidelis]
MLTARPSPLAETAAEVREVAMRYLARREYTETELIRKLEARGIDDVAAHSAVEALASDGLVSDERFAEVFTRQRVERLYGPVRIRMELRRKGVADDLAAAVLAEYDEQWYRRAEDWVSRSARGEPDQKERARLYRGGMRRGFTHDQVMRAMDRHRDTP